MFKIHFQGAVKQDSDQYSFITVIFIIINKFVFGPNELVVQLVRLG